MSILRISNCMYCNRKAVLTERIGGWTVDCYFSHPIHCVENNEGWCDAWEISGSPLFETPNDAIEHWNNENK